MRRYQKSVPPLLHELEYPQALGLLVTTQLAGALYLHSFNRIGITPGWSRFIVSLPVLLANLAAPLLFNRDANATTIVLIAFNTAWLSTFKALLWVINRSALASKNLHASQFGAMLLAPLTPVSESQPGRGGTSGRLGETAAGPRKMLLHGIVKLAMLGILARMLQHADRFHPYPRAFLYGIALYFILSSIMDGPGAILSSWLGVPVSPHFDQPWLSSSVVTFWSRRWDLAAGNVLRQLIYDPIVEKKLLGSAASTSASEKITESKKHTTATTTPQVLEATASAPPSLQWRRVLGSSASFLTSGLVHECIFWYLTGHISGGVWLSFFIIQIPIIIAERTVLYYLKQRVIVVPRPVMILYTAGFESIASSYLFWGPAEKAGLVAKVVSNVDVAYSQYVSVVNMVMGQRQVWMYAPVWLRTATSRIISAL